jgi:hypothetical protein
MGHKGVIEFDAGLCTVVVVTLGGLLLWTTVKLHRTRLAYTVCKRARAEALAVLDTVPLAAFRWPAGRDPEGHSVQTIAYPKFLAELAPADATLLEAARQVLHHNGVPFSLPVRLGGGGVFVMEGRRAASGETVLWLLDGGPAALARQAGEEAANLRELIDAIRCRSGGATATALWSIATARMRAPSMRPANWRWPKAGSWRRPVPAKRQRDARQTQTDAALAATS